MPSCGFFGGACVSLAISHCYVSICIMLCVVLALNSPQIKMRLVFPLQSTSVHFLGNCVEIIFTENKMKWKRSDGESAKAVREQVFLSRCKS